MDKNVGNLDRAIRVVAGLALISLPVFAPQVSYSYLGWLGVIPIITAFVGYCPLYSVLGIKTSDRRLGKP